MTAAVLPLQPLARRRPRVSEHESFRRALELAELGTIAGSVGHELNNLLTVLYSVHESIIERAQQGLPPTHEELGQLEHVVGHLGMHAEDLLSRARPKAERTERLDLRVIATNVLGLLQRSGRTKSVQVICNIPERPLWVWADARRLEQVVGNLVGNAVDATRYLESGEGRVAVEAYSCPENVVCQIGDNGHGIQRKDLSKVFQPYYTTKGEENGTGLGLTVVKRIVQAYGGQIDLESRVGKGTTARFSLPHKNHPNPGKTAWLRHKIRVRRLSRTLG